MLGCRWRKKLDVSKDILMCNTIAADGKKFEFVQFGWCGVHARKRRWRTEKLW
jgi:hypothetical protein